METYEQNTLARFTNLLPNVIELNKSLGTWQVALLEISWPSTIKNVTDGTFEANAAAFNDDDDSSDDLSNDDFESMDEEEEIKQENLSLQQASHAVIQQKQQLLLGAGTTVSRDNHSSSLLNWSCDEESDDDSESGEGSIRRDQISAGRYNSVDDLMMELCQKAFNTTRRWPISWTVRKENQRLEIHAAEIKEPSAQNNLSLLPFIRLVSANLQNILGVTTLSVQNYEPRSHFPVDIDAGLHNILVYCDLVQNEDLGDKGTSLLRSITLTHDDDNDRGVSAVSNRSFAKLQWKDVVKSAFQSITVSLRNEMGSLVPFLSRGRTSLTLKFRLQRNSAASF